MDLLKSLNKLGKTDLILRTLVWNSIVDTFKEKKGLDISSELISIQIRANTFIVKTNKPVINSEAYLLKDTIIEKILKKMEKLGIRRKDIQIKFI